MTIHQKSASGHKNNFDYDGGTISNLETFYFSYFGWAAKRGKTAKTAVLPGFCKIECSGNNCSAVVWLSYLPKIYCGYSGLNAWILHIYYLLQIKKMILEVAHCGALAHMPT